MLNFKDIIDLLGDKKNWTYVIAMFLAAFIWIPVTWLACNTYVYTPQLQYLKQRVEDLKQDVKDLKQDKAQLSAVNEQSERKIKAFESDHLTLTKQSSNIIVKDGTIQQNQHTISELNNTITQCSFEKTQLDNKIKELNFVVEQKNKVIEDFNKNEPIRAQIRSLQKERDSLLNPLLLSFKKEDEEQTARKAKELNGQIIELQKSITCKS